MKKTTEDYVKMIRLLQKKNGTVRSVAIAEAFGVSRPTVSNIVKRLVAEGYITMGDDYSIELTEKGLLLADETIERNRTIRDLLISLGVEQSIAEADACEMEHAVSTQSLEALKSLAKCKCFQA
jgi:Mn-dependent DtxR family transcriptional regulator